MKSSESNCINLQITNNIFSNSNIQHRINGTRITLENGQIVESKLVIDSTGLESRLVGRETPHYARGSQVSYPVGYQIAYGFIAHVDSLGPYDFKAMTLFDYRTDQYNDKQSLIEGIDKPTFMYTMPLGKLAFMYQFICEANYLLSQSNVMSFN